MSSDFKGMFAVPRSMLWSSLSRGLFFSSSFLGDLLAACKVRPCLRAIPALVLHRHEARVARQMDG